jgi:OmpA-OmpF porin, OOP family
MSCRLAPFTAWLVAAAAAAPLPGAAQAAASVLSADPETTRIIEGLNPETRGVVVPRGDQSPPSVGVTVTFPTGSARLTPAAETALTPLGEALASPILAGYRFRLEGHTDTVGSAATNLALSQRRAAAVRNHLVQRYGIGPERLEAVGMGETQPTVPTPDQTPEPRNRRLQVVNLGR